MDDNNIKVIPTADKRLGGDLGEVDGALKPLLECEYVMKALQNGSHINDLTWETTGDQSNYNADGAIKLPVWHRYGISCCADGKSETPHYIVGDYDKCIQDTHGNKNFKAVMIRGGLKVTVPAYTTADVYVTMASSLFKCGGETSSTWVGGIISDADSWKTVKDSNHNEWATRENSGVLPANDEDHITITQKDSQNYCTYRLGIVNYKADEITNETEQEICQEAKPVYIVCTVEKASTINQRLMVVDNIPGVNTIDADVLFRARIIYTGEAVDTEEEHEYVFSYKRPTAVKFRKPERSGYYQIGWMEKTTGRLYPPTCYFSEQRGIKLEAQWEALSVAYSVEHYLQKTDGTYADTPDYTVTCKNLTDAKAFAPVKEYAGYGKPKWEPATVKGDGSTVIKCYYPILEFPIEYCANGGRFKDDGTDFRVEKVVYSKGVLNCVSDVEREGYKFECWEPKLPSSMPAKKVTTRAVWTKLNNYYVEYEGEGATGGAMSRQTFELNQYQQLEANTYVRQYEVRFEIDIEGQVGSKQAEYLFTGWAEKSGGPKVYDDEAVVRNLTNTADATVTLYAVWKPQGIVLPKPEKDGYYFDGWYIDKECQTRAEIVEGQFIPSEDTTLYAQMISKEIPEISWYQDENEPVEERKIYACWCNDGKTKSYAVYLLLDGFKTYFNANVLPDGAKLIGDGGIFVQAPEAGTDMVAVDMTEIFKQNTDGGKYRFTVQPQIEGVKTDTSESGNIIALARLNDEDMKWDENYTTAMWKPIDGADYYLLWLYIDGRLYSQATNKDLAKVCSLEAYGDSRSCVKVKDTEVDLENAIGNIPNVYYKVGGYSSNIKEYYTPPYELGKSETI